MYLRQDTFNQIKTALKTEGNNATRVLRYCPAITQSYNTIRQVNKCADFQEYKEKYQPSKVDSTKVKKTEMIDDLLQIVETQKVIMEYCQILAERLDDQERLIKESIPWVR